MASPRPVPPLSRFVVKNGSHSAREMLGRDADAFVVHLEDAIAWRRARVDT